jgi:hypothetical protein
MAGATEAPRSFGSNEDLREIRGNLVRSHQIDPVAKAAGTRLPSRDKWAQPHPKCGWQDRRCWPTTRCLTRPRLDSDPCHSPSSTYIIRYVRHNFAIYIEYAICRCAGGGIPVAAHRAIMAHPDYGDPGIYREGHRASSKAKPRRDATFVPRSSERLICRCRGRIGPESDGAAPTSTRSHKTSGHPGWPRRGWSRDAFCSETHQRASYTDLRKFLERSVLFDLMPHSRCQL